MIFAEMDCGLVTSRSEFSDPEGGNRVLNVENPVVEEL